MATSSASATKQPVAAGAAWSKAAMFCASRAVRARPSSVRRWW
ncbi:hypothetical protein O1L68_05985 [Streptomyces lydicus]|nr:hypothetical protein [Streptomyces lydicus]